MPPLYINVDACRVDVLPNAVVSSPNPTALSESSANPYLIAAHILFVCLILRKLEADITADLHVSPKLMAIQIGAHLEFMKRYKISSLGALRILISEDP